MATIVSTTAAAPSKIEKKEEKPITAREKLAFDHIKTLQQRAKHSKKINIRSKDDQIKYKTDKEGLEIMTIDELLAGNIESDYDFLDRALTVLENSPKEEKPNIIVASGLPFGDFQHLLKQHQRIKDLTLTDQFATSKVIIDRLRNIADEVIYNISDDDLRIIQEKAADAVQILEGISRDSKKAHPTTWDRLMRIQESPVWKDCLDEEYNMIFEYMLRCGRTLLSKQEVQNVTGEPIEEYLLLTKVHKLLEQGKELPEIKNQLKEELELEVEQVEQVFEILEINNIPHKRRPKDNLTFTSNYTIDAKTKNKSRSIIGKHTWRQTGVSMVGDPTDPMRKQLAQHKAATGETFDVAITENEHMPMTNMFGDGDSNTLLYSAPGLLTYDIHKSGYASEMYSKNTRLGSVRGENYMAGIQSLKMLDDGRIRIKFMNDHFMNLAAKTSERHAILVMSDLQLASTTARPDLAVKTLDYGFHEVFSKLLGSVIANGDWSHGFNYDDFIHECGPMRLLSIDQQMLFGSGLVSDVLQGVPRETFSQRVEGIHIEPGNHEWNSNGKGKGTSGSTFSIPLQQAFFNATRGLCKTILHTNGFMKHGSQQPKAHTAIFETAGHKVLAQHMFLDKFAKGGSGPPINQFFQLVSSSAGNLMSEIDIMTAAHWHQHSHRVVANILGHINGSLAGLSGYEWMRGYSPIVGPSVIYLGGNEPPVIEILTPEFLYNYKCKGTFSDENLKKQGYETDKGFNPYKHGFGNMRVKTMNDWEELPKDAIMKKLWNDIDHLSWATTSIMKD